MRDGRCWRNALLMQQSSIYSPRSFIGRVCGTIRIYIFNTKETNNFKACGADAFFQVDTNNFDSPVGLLEAMELCG
jgi:hypothetical protein